MSKTSILCICLLLLLSCQTSQQSTQTTHFSRNVMTIDYHITVGDSLTTKQQQVVQKTIDQTFEEVNLIFNKWNPSSEISRINQLAAGVFHSLSPALLSFFERLDGLVQLSEGRFDPTVEPLQQLWIKKLKAGMEPDKSEIDAIKPCIGWKTISILNGVLCKQDGRTQIDLGGVAKGLCVDMLVENLQKVGCKDLYVEWGGEIRTSGMHPENRPWHVYISMLEDADPSKALAHVDMRDQALATSGDYFQYWTILAADGKEKKYCHVFNPLTLTPVEVRGGSVASASLLAKDCMTADALAKVLMLFDSAEEAEAWIGKLQKVDPCIEYWIAVR